MGTQIQGWIEIYDHDEWRTVRPIQEFVQSDYDLFGCLFGVRNYANFAPLFGERGIPEDSACVPDAEDDGTVPNLPGASNSEPTLHELAIGTHGFTWFYFYELWGIDEDEPALAPDSRPHRFLVGDNGEEIYDGKATWDPRLQDHLNDLKKNGVVRVEGAVYRRVTLKRADAMQSKGYRALVDVMEELANEYGATCVRVVVAFRG